jgi:hypothetical protein
MADIVFAKQIDDVHKFAVRDNAQPTYALDKHTIDALLKLAALVAKGRSDNECGHCEGCMIVAGIQHNLKAEIRKFVS